MLNFEALRIILLGIAADPYKAFGEPTTSSDFVPHSRSIRLREEWSIDGWHVESFGYVDDHSMWIFSDQSGSNTRHFGLRVKHERDQEVMISVLTFRVVAHNAGMIYEYTFNFSDGMPKLEMRQGPGVSVTADQVNMRPVPCIDLVVLDLIEKMMPPQAQVYLPTGINSTGSTKPCILCDDEIHHHDIMCSKCRTERLGAVFV